MMRARDNPFRTERVLQVRYRLQDETLVDLLERLKSLNYRASIVGPKGTGKTTLLEDLGTALTVGGFPTNHLRLNASGELTWERRHPCLLGSDKQSFTQRSSPRGFSRSLPPSFSRSFSRGFLKHFFSELTDGDIILFDGAEQMTRFEWHLFKLRSKKAQGLVITSHNKGMLPTLKECSTTPELLNDILGELLEEEAEGFRDSTVELYERHKGNLRDALREMYDFYAETNPPTGRRGETKHSPRQGWNVYRSGR